VQQIKFSPLKTETSTQHSHTEAIHSAVATRGVRENIFVKSTTSFFSIN